MQRNRATDDGSCHVRPRVGFALFATLSTHRHAKIRFYRILNRPNKSTPIDARSNSASNTFIGDIATYLQFGTHAACVWEYAKNTTLQLRPSS